MEDQKLVHEFLKSRSESAFLELYRSKTPHLYRMALRLTQDEYQSEELIQEMWVIAIRKLADFEWRSELKTWLIGILINLSRSKRKEKELSIEVTAEMAQEASMEMSFASAHDLENGISDLPPGYRQIIILHDIEGYKHKEIADLLDITEGTSKSQLFYARKALREYLSEDTSKGKSHE
ncbi:MAG: RNA polymerase sigma factor [Cyclobacteriaceae bacterium]